MIIKDIQLQEDAQSITVSAKCKIRKIGWDIIYFKVDKAHKDKIFADASPFASALLVPAMRLNQNLIVKGNISEKLLQGMQKIMDEMLTWDIHLHKIKIIPDTVTKDTVKPAKTASFFTGGVDSFYTFLKHRESNVNSSKIDTFIIVKGFDIKLSDEKLWTATISNVNQIAKEAQVDVVVVETNIREKIESMLLWDFKWFYPWDYIHGCCLAAAGQIVRNAYSCIYIPSTFSVEEQLPWGSHMAIDKYWSTEQLTFVHDGSEVTRPEKIFSLVSKSEIALDHLKVCYVNTNGALNCGVCEKCQRTMITFYIAGVLDKMKTFPHTFDFEKISEGPHHLGDGELILYGELLNLKYLQEKNLNPQLQAALKAAINNASTKKRTTIDKLKITILKTKAKATYLNYAYIGGIFNLF